MTARNRTKANTELAEIIKELEQEEVMTANTNIVSPLVYEMDQTVYSFEKFEEFECEIANSPLLKECGVRQDILVPYFKKIIAVPATVDENGKKKNGKLNVVGREWIIQELGVTLPEWGAPVWTFFLNVRADKSGLKASVGKFEYGEDGQPVIKDGKKVWVPKIVIQGLDEKVREALYKALRAIASDLSGETPKEKVNRAQR